MREGHSEAEWTDEHEAEFARRVGGIALRLARVLVTLSETDEALALARGKGLDLVLIVPDAEPPVARIMNYGKFKYEKEKRDKAAKKLAKVRIDMSAGGARCYFARGRRACPAMRQPH